VVLHQKDWSIVLGVHLPKMGVVFTETGCAYTGYLYSIFRSTPINGDVQVVRAPRDVLLGSTTPHCPVDLQQR
jgi:hypothetical protein